METLEKWHRYLQKFNVQWVTDSLTWEHNCNTPASEALGHCDSMGYRIFVWDCVSSPTLPARQRSERDREIGSPANSGLRKGFDK